MMKKKFNLKQFIMKNKVLFSLIIFILIFSAINLIRVSQTAYFPSHESNVFFNDFENYKTFSYSGINIFYEIVLELGFVFGQDIAIFITLFAFSVINIILFNSINKIILKKNITRLIANLLFILSNIFIVSFCTFSYLPIIIFFMLWTALYCFKNPKNLFIPIIAGALIGAPMFIANLFIAIVLCIILSKDRDHNYAEIKRNSFIKINILFPAIIFAILYHFKIITLNCVFLRKIPYLLGIINIQGIYIIPIIYTALAIFALFAEVKNMKITIIFLLTAGLSIINIYFGIISMFMIIFLAAIGIKHIISRKWFVKELRTPVIFLLILLFLFNSLSFGESIINSGPSNAIIHDVELLKNNTEKIFCDTQDCELIEVYSKEKVFYSTAQYKNKEDNLLKLNLTENMLLNSNVDVMIEFFKENNIKTVFISDKTLNKRWTRTDQGLLFLLTQSNRFIREKQTKESLIFYYIEEEIEE